MNPYWSNAFLLSQKRDSPILKLFTSINSCQISPFTLDYSHISASARSCKCYSTRKSTSSKCAQQLQVGRSYCIAITTVCFEARPRPAYCHSIVHMLETSLFHSKTTTTYLHSDEHSCTVSYDKRMKQEKNKGATEIVFYTDTKKVSATNYITHNCSHNQIAHLRKDENYCSMLNSEYGWLLLLIVQTTVLINLDSLRLKLSPFSKSCITNVPK